MTATKLFVFVNKCNRLHRLTNHRATEKCNFYFLRTRMLLDDNEGGLEAPGNFKLFRDYRCYRSTKLFVVCVDLFV
jgi:hypothetical protein